MTGNPALARRRRPTASALGEPHPPALRLVPRRDVERKFVTVLFADVKDSMGLSRAIDLEDWWSVTACLFELMCDAVHEFGGWVGNFTGDGIEAVFDTPDDHAHRACDAALRLRDAIRAPAAELWTAHRLELAIRVGLNSGPVLVGTIGDRRTRYYTVNGYPVALAKRIESLARPEAIYLTEHTAALAERPGQLRRLGLFDVRGASAPVEIFELLSNER